MNDKKLEAVQSLKLIEEMIMQAKGKFGENGHLYLLWGWVIFICSTFHFIALKWNLLSKPEMIYMLTWAAFIYQGFYSYKNRAKKKVSSYTDDLIGAVWLVFVCSGMLMAFVVSQKAGWETIYPLILMIYGIPTILSGVILRFKPLIYGGIFCWILCIVSPFVPFVYSLLFISFAVLVAWIIPGYLMQRRYTIENTTISG
jgi:hypothetical protein